MNDSLKTSIGSSLANVISWWKESATTKPTRSLAHGRFGSTVAGGADACLLRHLLSGMSIHRFDHVDLRVSDFAEARKFYDTFLRELGFPKIRVGRTEISYYAEGERKTAPFIGLNEEPGHRGNANRFAFWADTEEEVNRLGAIIREAGAQNIEGPEYCHDYTPGYYAVFFEDADGNKWEICCRNVRVR